MAQSVWLRMHCWQNVIESLHLGFILSTLKILMFLDFTVKGAFYFEKAIPMDSSISWGVFECLSCFWNDASSSSQTVAMLSTSPMISYSLCHELWWMSGSFQSLFWVERLSWGSPGTRKKKRCDNGLYFFCTPTWPSLYCFRVNWMALGSWFFISKQKRMNFKFCLKFELCSLCCTWGSLLCTHMNWWPKWQLPTTLHR